MRERNTILITVLTLALIATAGAAAVPQAQLSPEKKRALRKFDPADMVPEVQESQGDQGRNRSRQNGGRRAPTGNDASQPTGAEPGDQRGEGERSPAASSGASGNVSTRPTPSPEPKDEPIPKQTVMAMGQSSEPVAAAPLQPETTGERSGGAPGLSRPVIFSLLGLIFLALVVVVFKLKKDLRTL